MKHPDGRTLPVAALDERRRRAVMLRLSGMKLDDVCALAELGRDAVIAEVKAYRRGGLGGGGR